MSNPLTNKIYYIINTPVVDESILYTYDKSQTGIKRSNTISKAYSEIYYSDIVYDPNLVTTTNGVGNAKFDFGNAIYTSGGNQYSLSRGYNLYELSNYISNLLKKFIADLQLVNQCNQYAQNKDTIPSNCQNTFKGYSDRSKIDRTKLPQYQYSVMRGDRKKHLHQQMNDLNNIIVSYNKIIESVANNSSIPKDQYNVLVQTNNINIKLRNDLDEKLGEIYEYNTSEIVRSRTDLDNTMYTGIMWSILATSLIYIIFTKL